MSIQAVIFDFGGVLVRTEDRRPRTMLAGGFGLSSEQLEHLVFDSPSGRAAQLGLLTPEEHWETVRVRLGFRLEELPAVQTAFFGGDVVDRALVEEIQALRPRYKTALLSNAMAGLRGELARDGLLHLFDEIVISAEVGVMKPQAAIYEIAMARLAIPAHEAVFIDDFPHNLQGAQAAGIPGIRFTSREQTLSDLHALLQA